jgi:hypothetical protein
VGRGIWCIKAYASESVPLESQLGCTVAAERSSMDPHTLVPAGNERHSFLPIRCLYSDVVEFLSGQLSRSVALQSWTCTYTPLDFSFPNPTPKHSIGRANVPRHGIDTGMYLMQHAARRDLCISVDICCVARKPRLAEDAAYLLVLRPVASPSNNTITTSITAPHDAATRSPHGSSQTSCRRNTQHNINIGGYARTPALDPRSPRLRLSIALP